MEAEKLVLDAQLQVSVFSIMQALLLVCEGVIK
jgi:hypothetical protein